MTQTREILNRYSFILFVILTYAISWAVLLLTSDTNHIVAKFGPSIAGVLMALLLGGSVGLIELLKRIAIWNVHFKFYLIALLGPALIWALAVLIQSLLNGSAPVIELSNITVFASLFLTALFLGGGLGEELGWRGFALPQLQSKMSPISSSLLIGLVWGLWHAPVFVMADAERTGGVVALILFTIFAICLSLLFTAIFNSTRGSLLIPLILHGALNATENTFEQIFPVMQTESSYVFIYGGLILVMAVLLLIFRKRVGLGRIEIVKQA